MCFSQDSGERVAGEVLKKKERTSIIRPGFFSNQIDNPTAQYIIVFIDEVLDFRPLTIAKKPLEFVDPLLAIDRSACD
jgi:hypothetical protein